MPCRSRTHIPLGLEPSRLPTWLGHEIRSPCPRFGGSHARTSASRPARPNHVDARHGNPLRGACLMRRVSLRGCDEWTRRVSNPRPTEWCKPDLLAAFRRAFASCQHRVTKGASALSIQVVARLSGPSRALVLVTRRPGWGSFPATRPGSSPPPRTARQRRQLSCPIRACAVGGDPLRSDPPFSTVETGSGP
jgi:hypothetical protein